MFRKTITAGLAVAMLAVPASAMAGPGYNVPVTASCSGAAHGTHGYLGEKGQRHDLGQGDTTLHGQPEARCRRSGDRCCQQQRRLQVAG